MKLKYTKYGDYYLPNLVTLEESKETIGKEIGKYGRLRLNFLKEHKRVWYQQLLLNNKLHEYLVKTNGEAQTKVKALINELAKEENVDEKLKAENQLKWVQKMNNIKNRAEEIVCNEIIYT